MQNTKDITLYSYCIPVDDGAAPNPFWGICTLAICKPVIRRVVEIGDWVVGTGSKNSPIGDISKSVVYTMKITNKMTLKEYDQFCNRELPEKIPDWENKDFRRRLGDCIYNFSTDQPSQRKGVHTKDNIEKDLRGENVLISNHFYYFGDKPVELPEQLHPTIKQNQGHRSKSNTPYIAEFIRWIDGQNLKINQLYGNPQLKIFEDPDCVPKCAEYRSKEADIDERIARACSNY